MDFTESTKVVYNRIQELEPENVSKIIGYLLLQDYAEREMIRLAFCPDSLILSLVNKAKSELGLTINPGPLNHHPTHFNPYLSGGSVSSPVNIEFMHHGYPDHVPEAPLVGGPRSNRSPILPEFPGLRVCHYFLKGFCKHGNNCRYFHWLPPQETFTPMFGNGSNEDDNGLSAGSLEQLELEITEVLKSRRGLPVSIASLPMLYHEKFGKSLQADGYLTESQRHGKAGYSLTKLLARLNNSIRLIDRPHGQHSVILAEDIPKYLEYIGDRRNELGGIIIGSRQLYLTFPADSTFTEQDVSNYFSKFGPVQDVRLPFLPKRMFGFVTFVFSQTVKWILAKGNPHFVCGSRVLAKPYREKSKFVERKHMDKVQHVTYYGPNFIDGDSELNSVPRVYNNSRSLGTQFIEVHEQDIEFERLHFSEMRLVQESPTNQSYYEYSIDELNLQNDQAEFPSTERFNYLLDVLNTDSTAEGMRASYNGQDRSQGLSLPESPFASPLQSSVSAVI